MHSAKHNGTVIDLGSAPGRGALLQRIVDVQPTTDAEYASGRSDKSLTEGIQPGETVEVVVAATGPGDDAGEREANWLRPTFTAPQSTGSHTVRFGDLRSSFRIAPRTEQKEMTISGVDDRAVTPETNTPTQPTKTATAPPGSGPDQEAVSNASDAAQTAKDAAMPNGTDLNTKGLTAVLIALTAAVLWFRNG